MLFTIIIVYFVVGLWFAISEIKFLRGEFNLDTLILEKMHFLKYLCFWPFYFIKYML